MLTTTTDNRCQCAMLRFWFITPAVTFFYTHHVHIRQLKSWATNVNFILTLAEKLQREQHLRLWRPVTPRPFTEFPVPLNSKKKEKERRKVVMSCMEIFSFVGVIMRNAMFPYITVFFYFRKDCRVALQSYPSLLLWSRGL